MKFTAQEKAHIARTYGIHVPMGMDYLPEEFRFDYGMACDAQSPLVTVSSAGIPAYLSNYLDPEVVRVLVTPMKAASLVGETKKGDWTTDTAQFQVLENTGETSSYGDNNNNGAIGINPNFVSRQSYLYQTVTQWGERELEKAGLAKIDYAAGLNVASALVMGKFQNKSYLFGIAGLQNYGLLNDPSLSTPVAPIGGTAWSTKDGAAVYADIGQQLYGQLIAQTNGLVDTNTPMKLVMSPVASVNLTKTNQYNVNVIDQLKKNFPNMTIETVPEYATVGGQLVQLIVQSIDGQDVATCAFNEKMRAHPVVVEMSAFKQKKTGGTWGAIIKQPIAIAQLLGV